MKLENYQNHVCSVQITLYIGMHVRVCAQKIGVKEMSRGMRRICCVRPEPLIIRMADVRCESMCHDVKESEEIYTYGSRAGVSVR